jgi:MFS transporter, DHA2 family, multidrug resistance protein
VKSGDAAPWKPAHSPWLIAVAVMAATFMEVLDTSVANVSLPHIAGSLSVTSEESTWVLTSYIVANAIILPMTGWLSARFGRRRLFISCLIFFTFSSILCGMAGTLGFLVLARVLQGAGGGAMVPISQAILLESFPPHRRGAAMSVFAMGVVVAPILGPTLGGWITDNYSWRWIFYINVPVGAAAVAMARAWIEDPPYLRRVAGAVDWPGFVLLTLWLGLFQLVLDKGDQDNWFDAPWIRWASVSAFLALIGFIVRECRTPHPLVDLRVLRDWNFSTGLVLVTLVGVVLYGSTAGLPLFLQGSLGYPALQSGLVMSPRGLGAFAVTTIMGRLMGLFPLRGLILTGFSTLAFASFWLAGINAEIAPGQIVPPSVLNGVAVSLIFVPLTTLSMARLRQDQMGAATGLFNLMRNIGGGIGIALVTTVLARHAQTSRAAMVTHLATDSPIYMGVATTLASRFQGVTHNEAMRMAASILEARMDQQARLAAFIHNFQLFSFVCLLCLPLVLLFRKPGAVRGAPAAH